MLNLLTVLAVLGCHAQANSKMEQAATIEVVTFKVKPGVQIEQAKEKLTLLNECVQAFDGFIYRSFSVNEEGQWIDIVYWTSKEAALKAGEQVMNDPKAQEVFAIIDESSMQMNHYSLLDTFNN